MHQALGQKSESVKGHLSSSTYNAENFYRSSLFCIPLSISPFRPPKPMCALCSQGEILRREGVFNTPNGAWTWRWSVRDDVKKQMEWYTLVTGGDNGVSDAYLGPASDSATVVLTNVLVISLVQAVYCLGSIRGRKNRIWK